MSTPINGSPQVDIEFIDAEKQYFRHIKFGTLRNLTFEVLRITFNRLYSAFKDTEPFVYEKFIQSSIRRDELKTKSFKEMCEIYGYGIMVAVVEHAKPHQLPQIPTQTQNTVQRC